jgi:hypothetical protein
MGSFSPAPGRNLILNPKKTLECDQGKGPGEGEGEGMT